LHAISPPGQLVAPVGQEAKPQLLELEQSRMQSAPDSQTTLSQLLADSQLMSQEAPLVQEAWQLETDSQSMSHSVPAPEQLASQLFARQSISQLLPLSHVGLQLSAPEQSATQIPPELQSMSQSPEEQLM